MYQPVQDGDGDGDGGITNETLRRPASDDDRRPCHLPEESSSAASSKRWHAIAPLLVLLLLINLSTSLYQLPLNRVIERRLCKEWYQEHVIFPQDYPSPIHSPDGQVREEFCKVVDEVQQGIARYQQVMDMSWIVGDLIVTIPLGFVAEKYGTKAVLYLNLLPRAALLIGAVVVGYLEHLIPVQAIMLAPMLSVLGGDCVFNSITYALAAGITEHNVHRASYFGYMSSVSYIVALLGPALASATMSLLIWLPFWIGLLLLLLAVRAISNLPDNTKSTGIAVSPSSSEEAAETRPFMARSSSPILKAHHQQNDITHHPPAFQAIKRRFYILYSVFTSHPRNFNLLVASMFLTSLASADTKLLVQYISKRYTWTFASAGYLLSGKAVVNFVLLTVIVPAILRSQAAARRSGKYRATVLSFLFASPERTMILNAIICLLFSVIGALVIGLAGIIQVLIPGLFVYALGSALPVFTYSLLKSPQVSPVMVSTLSDSAAADDHHQQTRKPSSSADAAVARDTTVFSIVMIVKTIGSLVGVPLVTNLWIRGIRIGDRSLGIPYYMSSGCYAVALLVTASIRVD